MSENNDFDRKATEPEAETAEGQYVEGDYGTAGTAGENPAGAPEGEYPTGDYGSAGVAGATAPLPPLQEKSPALPGLPTIL